MLTDCQVAMVTDTGKEQCIVAAFIWYVDTRSLINFISLFSEKTDHDVICFEDYRFCGN